MRLEGQNEKMKINERVHLVASGSCGVRMSHDLDCNVYLVNAGTDYILIDSGVGESVGQVVEHIAADGLDPGKLKYILLTHGHLDHSGACRAFYDRFQTKVICSGQTADALEKGDEDAISLPDAKRAGIYPGHYRLEPCPVAHRVDDGDIFQFGDCHVRVLSTPGHSKDMISFLITYDQHRMLFCGDTIFYGGRVLLSNIKDCDVQDYVSSIKRLADLPFDGLFPGHHLWVMSRGDSHVKTATSYLDRLLLPPNLL